MTREETNQARLRLVDTSIRAAVENVLRGMEADTHHPVIAADVWRSPERQLELYNQGRSKLRWGFHNACLPNGDPASLAADIVCYEKGWNVEASWWLHLGFHTGRNGLGWGGYFGLEGEQRQRLEDCIKNQAFDMVGKVQLGWDPAHVQTAAVSVADARLGKR